MELELDICFINIGYLFLQKMTFQTDVRLSRQKQINTLAVFNELVECVVEGAEYRIQFRSSEQQQLTVCVKLPPDFPAAQPHVFIEVTALMDGC